MRKTIFFFVYHRECPKCKSSNFAKRIVCFTDGCGATNPLSVGPTDSGLAPVSQSDYSGDWECPKCKTKNFAKRTVCFTTDCGGTNNSAKKDWECPQCKTSNFSKRTVCFTKGCGGSNPNATKISSNISEKKDWECPKCKTRNFAKRTVCFTTGCGASNPVNPGTSRTRTDRRNEKTQRQKDMQNHPAGVGWGVKCTPDLVEANQKLREQFRKDPSSLSEEEQTRAKLLLARDERKKAKKAGK